MCANVFFEVLAASIPCFLFSDSHYNLEQPLIPLWVVLSGYIYLLDLLKSLLESAPAT